MFKISIAKILQTLFAAVFLILGIQSSSAESIAGKSIDISAKYMLKLCRNGQCKNTGPYKAHHKIYVTKDGRNILSYTGKGKGEHVQSGIKDKDGASITARGNKLLIHVPGNPTSVSTIVIRGKSCKYSAFLQWRGKNKIHGKLSQPTRCKVSEGNIFK